MTSRDERRGDLLTDARGALRAFREMTRRHPDDDTVPLDPRAAATCAAEHFAVLAISNAARGESAAWAYAKEAIQREFEALGGESGPLGPVLLRLLDQLDRATSNCGPAE